jgi:2-polyprenyl-6-methoxyphenol hydroxylase-like FAD-dependent oxidoreductase
VIYDVAVVGAGPAGLATAIGARLRGLDVMVADRAHGPIDKACGEGVMPTGRHALRELGVLDHLDFARTAPIRGIRYVNEDGTSVAGALPHGGGLGIRRVALSAALFARAREVGVDVREGVEVRWLGRDTRDDDGRPLHRLATNYDVAVARFLVAADGPRSPLRERLGLALPPGKSRRFGVRRHFGLEPWTDHVEVHFTEGVEAYVTPVGAREVGIAFLWDAYRFSGEASFDAQLARFPRLFERLRGAESTSNARGHGPLRHRARAVVAEDVALVGDAAGYVDAITGEGISLALHTAAVLTRELGDRRRGVMTGYARAHRAAFRRYARLADALLAVARRPALRRRAVALLARFPRLFGAALARAFSPE